MHAPTDVRICQDVGSTVAELVGAAAKEAIQAKGSFTIAIAGGSLVKMLGAMAKVPDVQWEKWHVAWVDERCVPHSDKESNYGGALEAWLSKVPIPREQVYAINEALTPGGGGIAVASKAAAEYERRLQAIPESVLPRARGLPAFDLLLLGFGPDGHMCSLFPKHALLKDRSSSWILPIADSPKAPPERITLSLQAVNAASKIIVVGTSAAKAEIVRQVFEPPCELPIAQARGQAQNGPIWVLDEAASASIATKLQTHAEQAMALIRHLTGVSGPPKRKEVCEAVAPRVAELVGQLATEAIAKHGAFSIAVAGGSLVKMLGAMADMPDVQWDKWHVAWVDERCVMHAHKESNYGGALDVWLSKVPIPKTQIYPIDEHLAHPGESAEAASEYEKRLKSLPEEALPRLMGGLPAFDLLLLGFGPDGHMCSLFPGHPLLQDTSGHWILPIADSPKPPLERITFSLPAVNASSNVIVVGTGEAKAEVVEQVFTAGCELPIAKAWGRHAEGPLWILDQDAAKLLQ